MTHEFKDLADSMMLKYWKQRSCGQNIENKGLRVRVKKKRPHGFGQ
jgi:hypothetical protein